MSESLNSTSHSEKEERKREIMQGSVLWFAEKKGYGFIKSTDHEKDIFFHVSGVTPRVKLTEGNAVSFDLVEGKKGTQAINVKRTRTP